jgi:ParB-like chromosome segregation protein Spo0J
VQLSTAWEPHERQRATVDRDGIPPGTRDPVRARELENAHRRLRAARADDLQADTFHALQRLSSGDERREQEVAQRPVLVEELAQCRTLDGDVLEWLGYEGVDEDRLPRQEVQLPEEPGRAVPDELVPGCVNDGDFSLADRNERISLIANLVEQVTGRRGTLLADLGDSR